MAAGSTARLALSLACVVAGIGVVGQSHHHHVHRGEDGESVFFLRSSGQLTSQKQLHRTASGDWICNGRPLPDPIIVVGTDGSGTRVIAKFLALTNVTMLVERSVYSQMDVDGSSAGTHSTVPFST